MSLHCAARGPCIVASADHPAMARFDGMRSTSSSAQEGREASRPVGFAREWPEGGERAVIAMGGNVGDRVGNFHRALKLLRQAGILVTRHACLYETAPAYVTDQPSFLNSAVEVLTHQSPEELLTTLKSIEMYLGRDFRTIRNGPRPMDLDIIFYGRRTVRSDTLQVPHPRFQDRPFVLAPIADLISLDDTAEQQSWASHDSLPEGGVHSVWQRLGGETAVGSADICRVMPVGQLKHVDAAPAQQDSPLPAPSNGSPQLASVNLFKQPAQFGNKSALRMWQLGPQQRPQVMGILNVTPDSFSDGGKFNTLAAAVTQAERMVEEGADMVDVGAQSTRPNATRVSTEEELNRVIPVIQALGANPKLTGVTISVDTFDSVVASAAVAAGAHVVNDVAGGTLDPNMFETVASLEVPYILMHMRGDPTTMCSRANTTYNDLVADVARELAQRAELAELAGVPAWQIMLDPGLGFAKTAEQSVELIRRLPELRERLGRLRPSLRHAPFVLGPSRKGFIGKLTGRAAGEKRDWGSCAAAAACVANGADVVRMHNALAGKGAVDVAVALWRSSMMSPQ